ncbi:MAG: arginine repressor [Planctomycetota bacterium]|jgi:transcriptional regulator of arginine metabolism
MQAKAVRQREILKVVAQRPVATQAELRTLLSRRGHRVDQATLSRDVRELGLVKVPDEGNGYRYGTVEEASPVVRRGSKALVGRFVRGVDRSGNLVVVKTDPGNSPPVALAIDGMGWKDVVGTVAGDDTILVIVRGRASAAKVARRIERMGR